MPEGGYDAVHRLAHIGGATLWRATARQQDFLGGRVSVPCERILPGIGDSQCGCKFFTARKARHGHTRPVALL